MYSDLFFLTNTPEFPRCMAMFEYLFLWNQQIIRQISDSGRLTDDDKMDPPSNDDLRPKI